MATMPGGGGAENDLTSPASFEKEEDASNWANPTAPPACPDNRKLLPRGDWTPASTQRTRQWVMYVLAATAGIALAILTASQFTGRSTGSAPVAVKLRTNAAPASPSATDPIDQSTSPAPLVPDGNNFVTGPTRDIPDVVAAEPAIAISPAAEPSFETSPVATPTITEPVSPADPLPAGIDGPEHREVPQPIRPPTKRKGPTRGLDIETQLARSLESFEIQQQPLLDFARFVSEFTYLPVTLDPVSLQQHEVSPLVPVSAELNQTTFQDLLPTILAPIELSATYDSKHGITIHHRAHHPAALAREIDVQEIAANPTEFRRLVQLIQRLVAPRTWRKQGGSGSLQGTTGTLIVDQTLSIHTEVERFCEQLRRARNKLSPLVPNSDSSGPGTKRQFPSVSLNFSQPTRLLQIIKRLEQEIGSRLVIHWDSLAQLGWYADSQSTLFTKAEPLDTALEQLFQPTPVSLSALGSNLYHVVAEAPTTAQMPIVFYAIGQKLTPDQATEQIRSLTEAIGTTHFDGSGGDGVICYDASSDCLIVRLPATLQSRVKSQLRRARDF
ncbi:MAG: hypothetical protein VX346_16190 [Planctomycetota bacterium]|nr:hypothetical protein [Planctomycetota bacterium]